MQKTPLLVLETSGKLICWNNNARNLLNIQDQKTLNDLHLFVPALVSKITNHENYIFSLYLDPKTYIFKSERLLTESDTQGFIIISGQESGKHEITNDNRNSKMQTMGEMAAGLAHEIRSPLQCLRNNIEFLQEATLPASAELATETRECFSESLDGLRIVTQIIDAIKDFTATNPDSQNETDVSQIIQETLALTKHEWKYDTEILFSPPEDPITLKIAPSDLFQIFINLIVNSEHAIQEAIQKDLIEKGIIKIKAGSKQGFMEIRFTDNGIGIKPGTEDLIFKPFFTTKKQGLGTGQGLSIIKRIIEEKNKGAIQVESKPEQGATFIITFKTGQS